MNKKFTTLLIALLAIVGMARGATDYGFSVGGVRITSANYQSITTNVTSGSVSFDPQTATLTLNNTKIDTRSAVSAYGNQLAALEFHPTYFKRFKVKLTGTVSLIGCSTGLYLDSNVTVIIDGPGNLQVTGYQYGNMSNWSSTGIYMGINSNV